MLLNILQWFRTAVPKPTLATAGVQLGCHLEEVHEMLVTLGWGQELAELKHVADELKAGTRKMPDLSPDERTRLLDDLCDQQVTGVGVAHMLGMDMACGLAAVNDANWDKFVDGVPIFKPNGKIAKREGWEAPDLNDCANPESTSEYVEFCAELSALLTAGERAGFSVQVTPPIDGGAYHTMTVTPCGQRTLEV